MQPLHHARLATHYRFASTGQSEAATTTLRPPGFVHSITGAAPGDGLDGSLARSHAAYHTALTGYCPISSSGVSSVSP